MDALRVSRLGRGAARTWALGRLIPPGASREYRRHYLRCVLLLSVPNRPRDLVLYARRAPSLRPQNSGAMSNAYVTSYSPCSFDGRGRWAGEPGDIWSSAQSDLSPELTSGAPGRSIEELSCQLSQQNGLVDQWNPRRSAAPRFDFRQVVAGPWRSSGDRQTAIPVRFASWPFRPISRRTKPCSMSSRDGTSSNPHARTRPFSRGRLSRTWGEVLKHVHVRPTSNWHCSSWGD